MDNVKVYDIWSYIARFLPNYTVSILRHVSMSLRILDPKQCSHVHDAIAGDDENSAKYLILAGYNRSNVISTAIRAGMKPVVKILTGCKERITQDNLNDAVDSKNVEMVKLVVKIIGYKKYHLTVDLFKHIATIDKVDIFGTLVEKQSSGYNDMLIRYHSVNIINHVLIRFASSGYLLLLFKKIAIEQNDMFMLDWLQWK